MKKHIILISVGLLNVLHGSFHIIQFIQSMFFVAYATHDHSHEESFIESVMHNPFFALFMGIIGILTLVIGVKDYLHHRKCNGKHTHTHGDKVMTLDEEFELTRKKANLLYHKIRERDEPKDKGGFVFWE